VGKGRNGGDFGEVVSPKSQIGHGLGLCEAVAGPLFPQRDITPPEVFFGHYLACRVDLFSRE